MKKILLVIAMAISISIYGQSIFINEIHYDNTRADVNEGIEIAGPAGTDLTGYKVRFYRSTGDYPTTSSVLNLSGTLPNQQNNMGVLWFNKSGIQNGSKDGMALVDNLGNVIQFISYEGVITATEGVAIGMTSVDIGVFEDETTPSTYSLQLVGSGSDVLS